jgi:uncharacterized protein (TIGR03084 family)
MTDVFEDLAQEYGALEALLESLDESAWNRPSLCPGWSVADVVLHLAQTEEAAVASLTQQVPQGEIPQAWAQQTETIDDAAEKAVVAERDQSPAQRFERWRAAHRGVLDALRAADPAEAFRWATVPLKPKTLATTRLSEHWIHANDIAVPLGIDYPDTDRLWHIARLAHRTVPYAYTRSGLEDPPVVRMELEGPGGDTWEFGEAGADCTIAGPASELCRIAARRLAPTEAPGIVTTGARAAEVLELIRTYA